MPGRKLFVYAAGGYYYGAYGLEALEDDLRSDIDRSYTVRPARGEA